MKRILIGLLALSSISAFAQVQQLKVGENLQIQCPAGSNIVVSEVNSRTANAYCGSVCRLEIMTQCDYDMTVDPRITSCGGTNTFLIVLKAPGKKLQALTNNHYDYQLVKSNLEGQAERITEEGICDKVTY